MRIVSLIAAGLVAGVIAQPAYAACAGISFGAAFSSAYNCTDLGTPTGLPANLGGLTFLNSNTLLIGGAANGASGVLKTISVTRDASNHITGFGGPSADYALAPYIDGGVAFGPGGVLFATGYPNNTVLQFKAGDTTPGKTITLSGVSGSVGTLQFVPTGFNGAGQLKIASYSSSTLYTATLTADGNGYYDISVGAGTSLPGGPEGLVYVDGANEGFGGIDSLLVSEYGSGRIGAYQIDANGDPILDTRVDFLTGLSGAEGAVIDPLTGDFLFSTFGGGNRLLVVGGFIAPPGGVPEPATWAMMLVGFGLAGVGMRKRRKAIAAA